LPYCKITVKCTDTENVQMNTCDAMCRNEYLHTSYLLFFPKNYAGAHIRDMLTLSANAYYKRLMTMNKKTITQ